MNEEIRFLAEKSQAAITHEWDLIAPERDAQIASDHDASFSRVLEPWVLSRLGEAKSVIDVGCGTGRLTSKLQGPDRQVIGLDPSASSIEIARSHDVQSDYIVATVEEWTTKNPDARCDLVVASMVLMDALQIDEVFTALARLSQRGRLLVTFTHPAFWPVYWGYATHPNFNYSDEILVEAPFKTASFEYSLSTTHVHRPLGRYIEALQNSGLEISCFEELRGPEAPEVFPFPRFIGIEAVPRDV
ncbi:class I SAM-dependent methyltransferase [Paeniglutamicibacter sp. ZC-3]|uniref:class I SAM-dependent methyltransferase n=1 Tax=Paeniglutamicibacter sp. ZC-3 TaxID=2986919 RepID=UPI0021F743FF|nr:class I SAM-dependent methyltransferase [Paeniglutamicibacter sp. ZC-3]MCV9996596.1 class I SAM-dependent methyltransferase [Paeniglutamicibacter sp. ZC-3]